MGTILGISVSTLYSGRLSRDHPDFINVDLPDPDWSHYMGSASCRRRSLGRQWLFTAFQLLLLCSLLPSQSWAQVTTSQYDNARTGANLNEKTLTPKNVNVNQFGKLFSLRVDGDIYAQPLYLPRIEIPGKGTHNVIFIATEHDSVYAFDADGDPRSPLWHVSFANPNAGVTTVRDRDVDCPFITPEVGITSTPVIDYQTGTLYVLARTKEGKGFLQSQYVQRLHALAITTGVEKFGGPVEIRASVEGRGAGKSGGQISFDPLRENPRAALLLVNGTVFLTWASSCDVGPYHGWVMAYDAHTLAQRAVFNTSPDDAESGIWAADAGPAADNDGNVFAATGNGKFDVTANGRDYGDTVLKLALNGQGLALRDYFTPFNHEELSGRDDDLGSGGPVLLPDQPGPHPHLLVVAGKGGVIYLIDRDHMGKFQTGSDSRAVQTIHLEGDSFFGAPAYWNRNVYFGRSDDALRDFAMENGHLSLKSTGNRFPDPGAIPTVSANGSKNAIVWVLASKGWQSPDRPAVLHAFDATNLASELYNSEQNSGRDRPGKALRFALPTVANGHVYVGTKGEVDVYGMLASTNK